MRWLLLVVALLSACVTSKGELPAPPSDADLVNDGSPEARERLKARYRAQSIESPGIKQTIGIRVNGAERPLALPGGLTHPDVRAYLGESPGPLVELLAVGLTPASMAFVAPWPLLFFASSGTLTVFDRNNPLPVSSEVRESVITVAFLMQLVAVLGLVVGGVAALGTCIVGILLAQYVNQARAEAINRFNARLEERIAAGARR